MKIVFVNRFYAPDHSATAQMLTDLAAAIAEERDVHVVTSRLKYDDTGTSYAPRGIVDGVVVHRVWTTSFGRRWLPGRIADYLSFYVSAALTLIRLLRRHDVVVAETDPPLISVPVAWIARLRGAVLVNWLQDIFPETAAELGVAMARGISGRALRTLRNRSLRRAAVNVVLGERMRRRVAVLGIAPAQLVVIPNWADGAALHPLAPDENPLRAEWMLDDKFVIGYSGNMGRAHEFDALLGAARALRDDASVAFVLIGDGAQRAALSEAIAHGLPNVQLKPYQPREALRQSLCVADVHIVTLRPALEGFVVPSKFYGAAAVARPTIYIGDPEGEVGSIVRETHCGLCVAPGDVKGLVDAIRQLRDDPALCERLGRNARRVLDERYDRSIAVAAWRATLRSLSTQAEPALQRARKSA